MMHRDYNPFANLALHIPTAYREDVKRFTTSQGGDGGTSIEFTPFIRYVDLWATAAAVGAQVEAFVTLGDKSAKHRFIEGSVLQGDLDRIEFLLLLAVSHTGDPFIVKDPRQVLDIAESFAAGGLPIVMEWLDSGGVQSPIVSLTKQLMKFLGEVQPSAASEAG